MAGEANDDPVPARGAGVAFAISSPDLSDPDSRHPEVPGPAGVVVVADVVVVVADVVVVVVVALLVDESLDPAAAEVDMATTGRAESSTTPRASRRHRETALGRRTRVALWTIRILDISSNLLGERNGVGVPTSEFYLMLRLPLLGECVGYATGR
jgi:hypothetical protein